jgi:HK97 family phage prohead protease
MGNDLWNNRSKAMERKTFQGIEFKKDKPGHFTARIATLNVIDKDGDVTVAGAFPDGKEILLSAYQHGSWMGSLPVGKAVIREKDGEAVIEGEFNLNSQTGKEHYETAKFAPQLQEWSYGFTILKSGEDERDGEKVRVLEKLDVFEASQVLLGAGVNTAVLTIKSHNLTYADESDQTLACLDAHIERTESLADLRVKEGRSLSEEKCNHIKSLIDRLQKLLDMTEPEKDYSTQLKLLEQEFHFLEVSNV